MKNGISSKTIIGLTTENFTTVRVEAEEVIYITSLYDEPGGRSNLRLQELTRRLAGRRLRYLLAGSLQQLGKR